jgi:DNA ligase-1
VKAFVRLFQKLDHTTSTLEKVAALKEYFSSSSASDSAWALYFLTGRKMKRLLSSKLLREWALDLTGISDWLFEESYSSVGDLGETIALLVKASDLDAPPYDEVLSEGSDLSLSDWIEKRLLPLRRLGAPQQKALVSSWWRELDSAPDLSEWVFPKASWSVHLQKSRQCHAHKSRIG